MKCVFSKRNCLILLIIVSIAYVSKCVNDFRHNREFVIHFAQAQLLGRFLRLSPPLPEDVVDESGMPVISWRAVYYEMLQKEGMESAPLNLLDFSKSWDNPSNLAAASAKPDFFFHPKDSIANGYGPLTCVVRIRETHEKIKEGTLLEKEKDKAYLVVVNPEYAVFWTKPYDVSWKELSSGKVELFKNKYTDKICYVTADLSHMKSIKCPKNIEEWRSFCGYEDEAP